MLVNLLPLGAGLAQAASTGRRTVIGIDPDNSGAIAVVKLGAASQGVGGEKDIMQALSNVEVEVFDMPLEKISVGKRQRRSVVLEPDPTPCPPLLTAYDTKYLHTFPLLWLLITGWAK